MEDPTEVDGGFTVIDGAAMVIGAAVASVHIRAAVPQGLPSDGWILIWGAFSGVAVTAAGPFLFLGRRFGRPTAGYPRVGDLLWALLGLPWLIAALLRTARPGDRPSPVDPAGIGLGVGLGLACLITLIVVWKTWVMVPPEQASRGWPATWTNRIGLILSVAWPLQCGFGLVVLEGSP